MLKMTEEQAATLGHLLANCATYDEGVDVAQTNDGDLVVTCRDERYPQTWRVMADGDWRTPA